MNKTSDKIYKITFLTVSDMGKRYYCDYCDKSFADSPTLRKNHMNGVHHHRNKKAHYDSMRGAEEILSEEQSKKSCKVFLSTGERESFDFVTKHFFFKGLVTQCLTQKKCSRSRKIPMPFIKATTGYTAHI